MKEEEEEEEEEGKEKRREKEIKRKRGGGGMLFIFKREAQGRMQPWNMDAAGDLLYIGIGIKNFRARATA